MQLLIPAFFIHDSLLTPHFPLLQQQFFGTLPPGWLEGYMYMYIYTHILLIGFLCFFKKSSQGNLIQGFGQRILVGTFWCWKTPYPQTESLGVGMYHARVVRRGLSWSIEVQRSAPEGLKDESSPQTLHFPRFFQSIRPDIGREAPRTVHFLLFTCGS